MVFVVALKVGGFREDGGGVKLLAEKEKVELFGGWRWF